MESVPCPVCGFDPRTVSPADAAVAVRSYPRRFRSVLVGPDGDEEPTPEDLVLRRPPGGGWSALDHAAWVAEVLALAADALERIRLQDTPSVTVEPPAPAAGAPGLGAVLDRMEDQAERLAQSVGRVDAHDWKRVGRLPDGGEVSALDVARHAVHQGFHHLRETERVLSELRGRG
jgi:DinB superfamily